MFFDKKDKEVRKCEACGSRSEAKFSFCPYCGNDFVDGKKEREDFGLLGRDDSLDSGEEQLGNLGFMDKIMSSMINSMMKNLDKQFKGLDGGFGLDENAEVRAFPNGVRIKISGPMVQNNTNRPKRAVQAQRREVTGGQLKRMNDLPRAIAKTSVRRLGNRVLYELATPGVVSVEDVFVSKLESGYEIKAIGEKKIYVNSVPINLPLKKYSILKNKLQMEFLAEHPQPQEFE
jgi:hypothetical protein